MLLARAGRHGLERRQRRLLTSYYDTHADAFIAGTRDADMSRLRRRFAVALPQPAGVPARILDAGCGSGRDARAFTEAGLATEAFDASPRIVTAATHHAGVAVRPMTFEQFAWEHPFEGILACASLLHVAESDLPEVLSRLVAHLVPGGVLYASFKVGPGERTEEERRFTDMTEDRLGALLDGCESIDRREMWRSRDVRRERSEAWLNALAWVT